MATYPNEAYPSEAAVLALDGTTDEATGLDYVARGVNANSSPSYEVQYNRRLARQNRILAALRQGAVVDEGSLSVGIYPIRYTLGGVRKSFDGVTALVLPDNATRVIYLDSSNLLQVAASFPASVSTYLPLATVVTSGGSVTITDERVLALFTVG